MEKLPRLRTDIQLLPAEVQGQRVVALKDTLGLRDGVVALRPQVVQLLPFFDGEHSMLDLQEAMMRMRGNQLIMRSEVEQLVRDLDALLMLESEGYLRRKQEVRQQFAGLPSRPAALAGSAYPEDPGEARDFVRGILGPPGVLDPCVTMRALIAPHIDLRAGGDVYRATYGRLPDQDFRRIVVLGTGHALDDGLFSLSPKSYATPMGSFPPDAKALEQLRQAGSGCLAPDDFAHRVEHSIEFQVLFLGITLQRNIPLVPILVGSLGKHLAIRRGIAEIPGVQEFLEALRAICGPGTLVVAGVDLSHVGPKFGHAEPAAVHEPDFREHDRKLLAALCRGSGEELWAEAQRVEDRFHVCGLATLATLLEILSGTTGEILAYQVWHEAATRSAVSFTAAMLIAYRAENAVWISPIEGGSPQRVIDLGKEKGAGDPFWSPDSRMVAVQPHNGDTELYIIPIDGTGRATATPTRIEVPGNGVPAGWTLENKIGFLFRSELKIALYTVNAAGGKPVQITPHGEDQSAPNWSLDGNRLFLDWKGRLSVVPADGGQPAAIPILSAKPILASGPVGAGNAVSPDGRTLVFSGTMNGVPAVNLWTIPVQGGEPTRLTSMQPPIEDRFPCWSPDGKEIAFLRWPDPTDWSTTRVCIIPVQGGQAREITKETDQVAISSVAWSPDGGLIAFYSRDGAVKVIPAAGGTARVVAQGALTKWQQRLSFSPNGRRLAYLDKSHKVTTVSVDGNGDPETVNIDLEDASFSDVVWSPDGERFVFKAVKGVAPELWLMEDFLPLVRR